MYNILVFFSIVALFVSRLVFSEGFAIDEKPIVVTITSYKNSAWYKKNLDSIFCQKYSNFRVFYIDDASGDNTAALVQQYVQKKGMANSFTLIRRDKHYGQLANHYYLFHLCHDDEIIVNLDGDDFFAGPNVLQEINLAYSNPEVWMTYGRFSYWPNPIHNNIKWGPIPNHVHLSASYRENARVSFQGKRWTWAHPRTFYACIAKQIKLADLIYEGSFVKLDPSADSAFMFPILEMVGHRSRFIDKLLYHWNTKNRNSQGAKNGKLQIAVHEMIASWNKYALLEVLDFQIQEKWKQETTDLLIFGLTHAETNELFRIVYDLKGINNIYIYMADFEKETITNDSKIQLPSNCFIISKSQQERFIEIIRGTQSSKYICIANGLDMSHLRKIKQAIYNLERTGAFCFYFKIQNPLEGALLDIGFECKAFELKYAGLKTIQLNDVSGYICRKADMLQVCKNSPTNCLEFIRTSFDHLMRSQKIIGLCFT